MEKCARDRHQRKVKSNEFVSSEMRKQILRLKDELCECEFCISNHYSEIAEIQDALFVAQECVQCLLSEDPFEAWKELIKRKEREDDDFLELEGCARPSVKSNKEKTKSYLPRRNVTKLITPEMRQRIDELKSELDEYAACVRQTLHDIRELGGLSTALELAGSLQGVDSLESSEARRKREEEKVDQEAALLALLDSL